LKETVAANISKRTSLWCVSNPFFDPVPCQNAILPACFQTLAEEDAAKNLPYLNFLEQVLEAESQAKHTRNVRLKTRGWIGSISTSSPRSMNARCLAFLET
jgi:hypothetical protein